MRQLNLFRGKRQRGIKPPSPKEFASHAFIADLLKRWCDPSWRYTHLPLGEKRDPITAGRLKRMGVTPGWPDFLFVGPAAMGILLGDHEPTIFWLELKRRGSRASDVQDDIAEHLMLCGHGYLCTDNVKQAVAVLKDKGILRSKIEVQ